MRDPNAEEDFVKKLNQTLTVPERRTQMLLQKRTSRMWRNFWISVMKTRGYSNVQIAKEMGLTESTVRSILKKEG